MLVRRFVWLLVCVWAISTVVFLLLRITGDPTYVYLSPDAPPEDLAELREAMGFDDPLHVQYVRFLSDLLRGSFGNSIHHERDALLLVVERLPATVQLAASGMLVAVLIGVPLGAVAAIRRNSFVEMFAMSFALFGQSIPSFWQGLVMIILLGVRLKWLPISGRGGFANLIMPAVTVAVNPMARITRLMRSSILEELGQDYVRTARAKGLKERVVLGTHVFRNAAIPVATLVGLNFGRLLGGTIVIETVFAWPGAGLLAVRAVRQRDFPVVQASVFVMGVVFVVINTAMDLFYTVLDPRIHLD
ncbi:MAG: ABC transporter permease [bacterium]